MTAAQASDLASLLTLLQGMGLKLALFLLVGALAWWLSRRRPMPEYGPQPVTRLDRWFLPIALAMAGAIEFGLEPALAWAQAAGPMGTAGTPGALRAPGGLDCLRHLPVWQQVLLYLLLTDFLGYWAHRAMHTPLLWRVHAFHHSPRHLNWLSGMRGSPLHMLLVVAPGALVGVWLLPGDGLAIAVPLMLLELGSQHFTHSNIRLPWARQLEWWLVTPRMHFVHHHVLPRYGHRNLGFYFSVWDHLFGTYTDADAVPDKGRLGLPEPYTLASLAIGLRLVETPRPTPGAKRP